MKHIIKLTIILSLFAQLCHAQKVVTEEEYKVLNDSIVSLLQITEKNADSYAGKPFSELVKYFNKCGVKITLITVAGHYDSEKVFPQHVYGLTLMFVSKEIDDLASIYDLNSPQVYVDFEGSKPYKKALSLFKQEDDGYSRSVTLYGDFTKEAEAFFSDAVIKSIKYGFMNRDIYSPIARKRLPLLKDTTKVQPKD